MKNENMYNIILLYIIIKATSINLLKSFQGQRTKFINIVILNDCAKYNLGFTKNY